MRAVIQRVAKASITINNNEKSAIKNGLLILLGVEINDNQEDVEWLSRKISQLRIFNDKEGLMNLSVKQINGEVLLVSQFTLHAKTKKGTRPSFIKAAKPEKSIPLYEAFITQMESDINMPIKTGKFGADMQVEIVNDGPVTIIIDTKNKE